MKAKSYRCNNTMCKSFDKCAWGHTVEGEDLMNPQVEIEECQMFLIHKENEQ